MHVRPYLPSDLDGLIALTIATFRPFYEQSFPAMVGHDADLIAHQHGQWEQDYRDEVPILHDPDHGRHVRVAVIAGEPAGCVAWKPDVRPRSAEIHLLAVAEQYRGRGVGTALMTRACDELRDADVRVVGLGTGGDAFHAPARRLYAAMGFHPVPIVGYLRRL